MEPTEGMFNSPDVWFFCRGAWSLNCWRGGFSLRRPCPEVPTFPGWLGPRARFCCSCEFTAVVVTTLVTLCTVIQ